MLQTTNTLNVKEIRGLVRVRALSISYLVAIFIEYIGAYKVCSGRDIEVDNPIVQFYATVYRLGWLVRNKA
ncbi:unnamed protein product [Cochlearia groenlandica]